jgi:SAM-dependent methyltransferase/uncharacterized protein YbaR (Trm112 family)
MSVSLEGLIQCPECCGRLELGDERHCCTQCSRSYIIEDGVHVLLTPDSQEQPPFYDDPEYRKYLSQMELLHSEHYRPESLTGRIENDIKKRMVSLVQDAAIPFVDLGCGTGQGFAMLGAERDIIGVDNNMNLLYRCRQLHPNVTLICCDMRRPPFVPQAFQSVFSIGTLEHVFHLESFVESAANMLTESGHFYVEVPTEGGILWGAGRSLLTSPRNSRLLGVDYSRIIKKDHCNTVFAVQNVLEKHFIIEKLLQYPFGFGGPHCNVAFMYRLKKRRFRSRI